MANSFQHSSIPAEAIRREVADLLERERPPSEDAFNLAWPHAPQEVTELALDVQRRFRNLNGFFTSFSPALSHVDKELRAMVAEILHAPSMDGVTITVGGTESNFLAVKTARDKFRAERKVPSGVRLNMVVPYTAHPSFDKHAQMMDLDIVRAPVTKQWQADCSAIERAISERTFMIVGSVPSYTHGAIDPISGLAEIAIRKDVWLHVDACVGGFLHPFLKRRNNLADFDFSVPGVASISADLHKFGYCLNGISSFTLRDKANLTYQTFEAESVWPTGKYVRKTFVGSRSGSVVAAAWAVFKHLGAEGFTTIAERIAKASEIMADGLSEIEGLEVNVPPKCGVLSIAVDRALPIGYLAKAIEDRGFHVGRAETPPSLHFLLDPVDDELLFRYLHAIAEAVKDVRGRQAPAADDGAPIYGA